MTLLYRDLTHLNTYTIDEDNTLEIDDAISLERFNNKQIIWIHIADVSLYINKDSDVDKEAFRKSTSMYFAERIEYMFSKDISSELLSLKAGFKKSSLSVSVELDDQGKIITSKIVKAWIKPKYRLSYGDADELIELKPPEEEDLFILHNLLLRRRLVREMNSAINIEETQGRFYKTGDSIDIRYIEPCNSRRLISEAMILFGTVISEYGRLNKIPLPYRTQAFSDITIDKVYLNHDIISNFIKKRLIQQPIVDVIPKSHFSLGLACYVQATSPIRRYSDLIVHRQIISFISERKFIEVNELRTILRTLDNNVRQANQIMKESNIIVALEWFTNQRKIKYKVIFLKWMKQDKNICLLHFTEICMSFICRLAQKNILELGDNIEITINKSNLNKDFFYCSVDNIVKFSVI